MRLYVYLTNVLLSFDTKITYRCDVTSPTYVSVHWRRAGSNPGRLPQEAIMSDQGRALLLPSLTQALAGTYECVATSRFEKKSDSAVVSIQSKVLCIPYTASCVTDSDCLKFDLRATYTND